MAKTIDALLHKIAEPATKTTLKVTVVGVGAVGMACAYSIMQQVVYKPYSNTATASNCIKIVQMCERSNICRELPVSCALLT